MLIVSAYLIGMQPDINKIYFDPENPANFCNIKYKIGLHKVRNVLHKQDAYRVFINPLEEDILGNHTITHTGKCIRRFAGIYVYCRYFIDRKCSILVLTLY